VLDLVAIPEIAAMLHCSPRTVARYAQRPDFPQPVAEVGGRRIWSREDVTAWAAATLPLGTDPRRRKSR
jgi:predicted DNA-binding transcriptional regulator AlpA